MNQYDEIIKNILKEQEALKKEVARLATQHPLYTVLNTNDPSQITSDQNDYDPGDYDLLRLTTDASRNISGFAGGTTGRVLYLINSGSNNIVLLSNSALSAAANRIFLPGNVSHTMTPSATGTRSRALLIYGANSRWWLMFESAP